MTKTYRYALKRCSHASAADRLRHRPNRFRSKSQRRSTTSLRSRTTSPTRTSSTRPVAHRDRSRPSPSKPRPPNSLIRLRSSTTGRRPPTRRTNRTRTRTSTRPWRAIRRLRRRPHRPNRHGHGSHPRRNHPHLGLPALPQRHPRPRPPLATTRRGTRTPITMNNDSRSTTSGSVSSPWDS